MANEESEKPGQAYHIVCNPADAAWTVEGATFTHDCYVCGHKVMMAPSSERFLKAHPESKIVCTSCVVAEKVPMPTEFRLPASIETIRAEATRAIPNTRRNRN